MLIGFCNRCKRPILIAVMAGGANDFLLLETGDFLLLETGDYLILE